MVIKMKIILKPIILLNENYLEKEYKFLSFKKKEQIKKIYNNNDKKLLISSEIIKKELLQNNPSPKIYYNFFNKPYLKEKNVFFNISHSNKYVIGVINNTPIGIDIQKKKDISYNIAKKVCTANELKYIFQNPKTAKNKFFEIFTIKEALIKMLGINYTYFKNIEIKKTKKQYFIHKNIKIVTLNYENYVISICTYEKTNK